jgi:hypothetical protein
MENHGKPTAEQTKGDATSLQQGSAPSPTPSLFLDAKAGGQVKISTKAKPQGLKDCDYGINAISMPGQNPRFHPCRGPISHASAIPARLDHTNLAAPRQI